MDILFTVIFACGSLIDIVQKISTDPTALASCLLIWTMLFGVGFAVSFGTDTMFSHLSKIDDDLSEENDLSVWDYAPVGVTILIVAIALTQNAFPLVVGSFLGTKLQQHLEKSVTL